MKVSKMVVAPAVLATAFAAYGFVKTATPFADNMVLQRGRAVPVWGVADPGEKVTVAFAGQTKTAQAGADGKWSVSLDAMDASKRTASSRSPARPTPRRSGTSSWAKCGSRADSPTRSAPSGDPVRATATDRAP